jgi:hypothetical protein
MVRTPVSGQSERNSRKDPCRWSPFEPAWEWTHNFYPGPTAKFDADDVWDGGEVEIPIAGGLGAVARRGLIHDGEYGVEYAGGPGVHEVTIEIGDRINLRKVSTDDGRFKVSGRRMGKEGTLGTYDIETEVPFLVLSSPPKLICKEDFTRSTPSFHTLVQSESGEMTALRADMLSSVQWTHNMQDGIDHPREYWIAFFPRQLGEARSVRLTLAEYRFREFKFYIRPPSLELYEQLGLLPETVTSRGAKRD